MKMLNKLFWRILGLPKMIYCLFFGVKGAFHFSLGSQKKYCQGTIDYLNKRKVRNSVVDIGCGLGDVLRHLNYNTKVGLDHYQNILDSLSLLSKIFFWRGKIETHLYDFNKDHLHGKYDVIILLNWPHKVEPKILREKFEVMYKTNLNPGGEIIFDVISSDVLNSPYPYHHSADYINKSMHADVNVVGRYYNDHMAVHGIRSVVSLKK